MNWLTGVKYLKESGMSIEAIKEYVELCLEGDTTLQRRYEIFLEQQRKAHAQLEEAIKRTQFMDNKVEHLSQIINKVIPDDMNPGEWEKETKLAAFSSK